MKLEPLIEMPASWSGVWRRFGVHLFEGQVTVADMDRLDALGTTWRRKNPGKLVELSVIFPSNARMSGEERARMAKVIKRWEHERVASATVILADGLLGAMQRSVLTGMLMLAPPPHPAKVFGQVRDAAPWLAPYLHSLIGDEATPERMVAAVAEFSGAFQARR